MREDDERTKTKRVQHIYLGEQLRGVGVPFDTPETDGATPVDRLAGVCESETSRRLEPIIRVPGPGK